MSTELNPSDRPDISSDRAGLSRLSSAMDGDLWPGAVDEVLAVWRQDAGSRVAWHDYHLIGDVLRSEDLAAAPAGDSCEAKAVSKAGKPLAGAAKTAFMKKCEADAKGGATGGAPAACEGKAVSKEGKPLAGAAKTAFLKKCEADAKAGK